MASPVFDENNQMTITLNPKQSVVWNSLFDDKGMIKTDAPREFSFWGAYRSGKTLPYMLIAYMLCKMYPGLNWLYCRATYGELEDSVIQQFQMMLPPEICGYQYKMHKRQAIFDNGSIINFRAFDKDKKILSNEYDAVTFCQAEEIPHRLFLQVLGRLSGSRLPKNFMFIEGNPEDDCWPKDRYKGDDGLPDDCLYVEVATHDNERNLPPNYIDTLIKEYPEDWIDKYVFGKWSVKIGRVYSEFRQEIHVVKPFNIPDHWYKIIGFDHGTENPTAMTWISVDEQGKLYVYDEYYERRKHPFEIAEGNKKNGSFVTIADYNIKAKIPKANGTWGSIWGDLEEEGMRLVEATKDKKANIILVNSLFKQNRLFIFDTCYRTISEHKKYRWKPAKPGEEDNPPEEVVKKNDHTCDCVQYAVRYLKDKKVLEPTPYPKTDTLEYHVKRFDRELSINQG